MELSVDHGYGFGSEDGFIELAFDLRVHAPNGLGAVLRMGGAAQIMSAAFAVDAGIAYRVELVSSDLAALQLGLALGPSVAYGPFDRGMVPAYGGFAMAHFDVRFSRFFVGLGVSAHALMPDGPGEQSGSRTTSPSRDAPLLALTPTLRVGGEWGL